MSVMSRYTNPTLGEIVGAAERRAASGEKLHPGFDFASLAPSPLKQREAADSPPAPNSDAQGAPRARADGAGQPPIEADLDNAWTRLKRSINPS